MSRARDLADSADKDIAGTLTVDAVDVQGTVTADGVVVNSQTTLTGELSVTSTSDSRQITFARTDASGGEGGIGANLFNALNVWNDSGNNVLNISQGGDISFYEDTGTTAKFFWDASLESLGIGTTTLTPTDGANIELSSATSSRVILDSTGTGGRKYTMATGTNGSLDFYDYDASAYRMSIDSSGNVGIGTTSPSQKLQVDGGAFRVTGNYSSIANNQGLMLGYTGDSASYYAVGANGGGVGQHIFYGYNYSTGAGSERMRIDSAGNVGIGTTSPTSLLSVGTLGSTSHARIQVGSSNSTTGSVYFGDGTGASLYAGYVQYSHAENSLAFGSNSAERMRIDSSGLVQIGASSFTGSRELRIDTGSGSSVGQDSIINSYRSNADLIIKTNNAEVMRIDSSGNVGVGTSSPDAKLDVTASGGQVLIDTNGFITSKQSLDTVSAGGRFVGKSNRGTLGSIHIEQTTTSADGGYIQFRTSPSGSTTPTERMRIDSSGNVGIGTTSPAAKMEISGANGDQLMLDNAGERFTQIDLSNNGTVTGRLWVDETLDLTALQGASGKSVAFYVDGNSASNYAVGIDTSGNVNVGCTDGNSLYNNSGTNTGAGVLANGQIQQAVYQDVVHYVNRTGNDGTLVGFQQEGAAEGTISVSGSTVSYNGGHLARWSRLPDDSKDTSIVKGTVMTNLDAMVVWSHDAVEAVEAQDAVYDEDGNVVTEAVEAVEARDAYTEDNEQLNKMAVSSVEGDPNVAGVFVNWDEEDDFNDMNIAMTGDMVIRIAQGTTVARGDLLMSAGDGTAKLQGDDIVRSKTIAKVTSTHVSHTYDDGSYLVPCVLMAC